MADFESLRHLTHLYILDRSADEAFERRGRGNPKIREVERRAHGLAVRGQLEAALEAGEQDRAAITEDELRALGTMITLEGADADFPLRVDSLQSFSRHRVQARVPRWLLLSVTPASETQPEQAVVWVSDRYRAQFLGLFEAYLNETTRRGDPERWETEEGNPKNRALVANIARIRETVLRDLWQSDGEPSLAGLQWWEIWLDTSQGDALEETREYAQTRQVRLREKSLQIGDRLVVWIEARWQELEALPFTDVPVAEIRRPEFVDTVEDLQDAQQAEYVDDLAGRIIPASELSPYVCHLDTGVLQSHRLLADSLAVADVHSVLGSSGLDVRDHGTGMASLALLGPLDELLTGTGPVQLHHRLESVRIFPGPGESIDPLDFGTTTAQAVATPESFVRRRRVFCLPISADPDRPGQPTLWSATVDALAAGVQVARDGEDLQLIGQPEDESKRLVVIAAGNVDDYMSDHLANSDSSAISDPGQAWNALTVGAFTSLVGTPSDPQYENWNSMADAGELSPHSRTSLLFGRKPWPIKPDICMEGGNVLTDGWMHEPRHPMLSLRAASSTNDMALASSNATSAATAQASRLAALIMRYYPDYWPETVRGLLVHAAEWTPAMRARIDADESRRARQVLLRRYGWGTPSEDAVLRSSAQAVTLVSEDSFVAFEGDEFRTRRFRLHQLPWPSEVLEQIPDEDVTMKVTLSYFIEPSASRRGWRQRYSYPSHALRFDLQNPLETVAQFVARVNQQAGDDEDGAPSAASSSRRWLIGPQGRDLGSIHQDIWEGSGQELAQCNSIAVYPVGGWWKRNKRRDRLDLPVRYSLIVSLKTQANGIDLYTPIATEIGLPVEVVGT